MADYNEDKRLKQDTIEREKKQNASTGMVITAIVIAVGIVIGFYFYNRPVPPVVNDATTIVPASAPIPVEAPVNHEARPAPADQPVDTTTTETTTAPAATDTAQ